MILKDMRYMFPIHRCLSPAKPQHHPCFKHQLFLGIMNFTQEKSWLFHSKISSYPIHCLSPAKPQQHPCFKHQWAWRLVNIIIIRNMYFLMFPANRDDIEGHEMVPIYCLPLVLPQQHPCFKHGLLLGMMNFHIGNVYARIIIIF